MMWLAISIVHRTERPFATTGRINHLLVKDHESLNNPVVFECSLYDCSCSVSAIMEFP